MGYTMIAAFAGSLPGQMDEVRSAFENGDTPSLAEAAHKIKGVAASDTTNIQFKAGRVAWHK